MNSCMGCGPTTRPLAGIMDYAQTGAGIGSTVGGIAGSIIPGAGTAIGAGVGAASGAIYGAAYGWLFGKPDNSGVNYQALGAQYGSQQQNYAPPPPARMPAWVLPVGIGAGVLVLGGIAFAALRNRK